MVSSRYYLELEYYNNNNNKSNTKRRFFDFESLWVQWHPAISSGRPPDRSPSSFEPIGHRHPWRRQLAVTEVKLVVWPNR